MDLRHVGTLNMNREVYKVINCVYDSKGTDCSIHWNVEYKKLLLPFDFLFTSAFVLYGIRNVGIWAVL